jgi:hypothetical protein
MRVVWLSGYYPVTSNRIVIIPLFKDPRAIGRLHQVKNLSLCMHDALRFEHLLNRNFHGYRIQHRRNDYV